MIQTTAITIRPAREADGAGVRLVNRLAFGGDVEADLVERLRPAARPLIELVAEQEDRVIGHVLFSPVTIGDDAGPFMGLGPVAVLPERQRRGIGSELITAGLERCRDAGAAIVVVLGHPEYYPRFGFRPAFAHGLWLDEARPQPAFMVLELHAGALQGLGGRVRYRPEFDGV